MRPPEPAEAKRLTKDHTLISFFYPAQNKDLLEACNKQGARVIDPFIGYSTYLGGSGTDGWAYSAADASGKVYFATTSPQRSFTGALLPGQAVAVTSIA